MIDLTKVDPRAIKLGQMRLAVHDRAGSRNPRFFKDRTVEHIIGAAGEYKFADTFGLTVDESERWLGDKGIDFVTSIGTIDVKTAQQSGWALSEEYLLVKESSLREHKIADIIVKARIESDGSVELLRWCWSEEVKTWPTRNFTPTIKSHYKLVFELRHLRDLFRELYPFSL